MSPVAVPADRRFHRAHVKPGRRRGVVRAALLVVARYGIIAALLLFAVARSAAFLSASPVLRISTIDADGNQRVSTDEIRTTLIGLRGENLLFVDLNVWRAKLLELPWVADASFRRSLPSSVAVVVRERTPIAIGRMGNRLYLVDEGGAAIDEYGPRYGNLDLPIVDGFSAGGKNRALDDQRGALAARLIMSLRQKPAVAGRLSQVDVSDVHNATILLNDDPAELRVGDDRFLERVESYLSLTDALHQRVPDIDYVDLRFDGRVYVRPLGKSGKAAAAGAGRPKLSRVTDAEQHQ
ncbi:MAG TPA: FtsQ-type POTRA domain-containing protein [Vicinamibacterales bacterium]|nr:FtsQ-type POTRA domain-containing protein [Vicinamibacterales bacterium]